MSAPSVDAARAAMLAETPRLAAEPVALADAIGRVLAEPVAARRDQPPFHASAMDGWAVRAADAPGLLRIVGESAAGHGFDGVLRSGETVRIFTGAAVPEGADAIVIQEDARRDGETVEVPAVAAGTFVRPRGGDFRQSQPLLEAGVRIDPWRLALAASSGRAEVSVVRRPRVVVVSTGEEVVTPPGEPGPWQIYDSAGPALAAMVAGWGADVRAAAPVGDTLEALVESLSAEGADLFVTIGGASVGDHDLVRAAAARLGGRLVVEGVNVRPGRPTFFGVLASGARILGLPGNPASAMVCAQLFLRPVLAAFEGVTAEPALALARVTAPLPANGPREHWMRARLAAGPDGGWAVEAYPDQDSSLVTVFARADALLRRPAGAPAVAPGGLVEVLALDRA